jgi:hypothetical protein
MVNNRRKLTQRAGAYADFTQVKTCNLEPNVEQYKAPCTTLTDNQFGFKDIVGYYSGGRRSRRQNGGCGDAITDCMGNKISNMGDMTHLSTASEQAWFNRNTYGAPSSTNEVPQKGGRKRKSNQRSNKQQNRQKSRKNKW